MTLRAPSAARVPAHSPRCERRLAREKFAARARQTRFTAAFLLARYTQLATLIAPTEVTVPELRDPKDLHVLACALAARSDAIVSGDADLRTLGSYQGIPVLSPVDCLRGVAT